MEVWVTNKSGRYDQARNVVAFTDLGESTRLANNYWVPDMSAPVPSNSSNNLLQTIKTEYPDARNINAVTQALAPLEPTA